MFCAEVVSLQENFYLTLRKEFIPRLHFRVFFKQYSDVNILTYFQIPFETEIQKIQGKNIIKITIYLAGSVDI